MVRLALNASYAAYNNAGCDDTNVWGRVTDAQRKVEAWLKTLPIPPNQPEKP